MVSCALGALKDYLGCARDQPQLKTLTEHVTEIILTLNA